MDYAPNDLLTIRDYVKSQTGLDDNSLGIVGDPAHASTGGYHQAKYSLTLINKQNTDYSVRESSRDKNGLTDAASAFDIGSFSRLIEVSNKLVDMAINRHPTMVDVREIIFSPDGNIVRRWDALGIRDYGDSSHLYHTHTSFFRDSEGRRHLNDNFMGALQYVFEGISISDFGDDEMNTTPSYRIPAGFAQRDLIPDPESTTGGMQWDPSKMSYEMIPSLKYDAPGKKGYIRFFGELPGGTRQTALLRVAIRIDGGGFDVRSFTFDSRLAPNSNSFQLPANATAIEVIRQPQDAADPGILPLSWLVAYYA